MSAKVITDLLITLVKAGCNMMYGGKITCNLAFIQVYIIDSCAILKNFVYPSFQHIWEIGKN